MNMTRMWTLTLIVALQSVLGFTARDFEYEIVDGLADKHFTDSTSQHIEGVRTLSLCVTHCVRYECLSFTYNKDDQTCRLYRILCFTSKIGTSSIGAKLYIKLKKQVVSGSCKDTTSPGLYWINPSPGHTVKVYCEENGWTVFQRRYDGSQDFFLGWNDYKQGFGSVACEHWLGNDNLHLMTKTGTHDLRIEMDGWNGTSKYAEYTDFYIATEAINYKLTINTYSGNAGDSLRLHNNEFFTTDDRDNDSGPGNCATDEKGAFWYHQCSTANLNGLYETDITKEGYTFMLWYDFYPGWYPIKGSKMMLRKRN